MNYYLFLMIMKKKNQGIKSFIHGDTVLTNILINSFGKIKFIDMRGKQGNILTNLGDIFYDWAKIYQSIIGYDEILENKSINNEYKNNIIEYFENWFTNKFSSEYLNILKYITKLHLFTLLPLHNNDKCFKYYNLINKI